MHRGVTAVYRCFSGGSALLYVGIGREPFRRFETHMDKLWFRLVSRIEVEWFSQRHLAKQAETIAIHTEYPAFNICENKHHDRLSARFDLGVLPKYLDIPVKIIGEYHPQDPTGWDRRFRVKYAVS